jgi:hypothetical protein
MTLITQDLPQMIIHIVFLFAMPLSLIPHSDFTVIFSLCTGTVAFGVSLFNVIMSKPNKFDPVLLSQALEKRQERKSNIKSGATLMTGTLGGF